MAIERLSIIFTGEIYKYRKDSFERDGKTYDSYKLLFDQNDSVHTLNIKEELYNSVPRGTTATVHAEYVTGGAYISATHIVVCDDDYNAARDKAAADLESEMLASGELTSETGADASTKPVKAGGKKSQ